MDSDKIETYISNLTGWQQENLVRFRQLVHTAVPDVTEAWKWDVPVFLCNGRLLCAMSTFIAHTKYNFFDGAALDDSHKLFNSGLESKRNRSINLSEAETLDQDQLADLLKQAAARTARS